MEVIVRRAENNEIGWINEQYEKIDFPLSDIDNEILAIAEVDGKRVGMGRLIKIDDENAEFGGMYTFDDYRKLGIGRKVAEFLLPFMKNYKRTWCMYYAYMDAFYRSLGFKDVENLDEAPERIRTKFQWCRKHYTDKDVKILVM